MPAWSDTCLCVACCMLQAALQEQLDTLASEKAGLDEHMTAQLHGLQQQLSIARQEQQHLEGQLAASQQELSEVG